MAHRREIDFAYMDEILELRRVLIRSLGTTRSGMLQIYGPQRTDLPRAPVPPELTVVDNPGQQDPLNNVNNDVNATESPESAVGANSSAFERGQGDRFWWTTPRKAYHERRLDRIRHGL